MVRTAAVWFSVVLATQIWFSTGQRADDPEGQVFGPKTTVSKQQALQECQRENDELAGQEVFDGNIVTALQNGESAWISGHAEFSPFLYWHGCLKVEGYFPAPMKSFTENNIFVCANHCVKYASLYIGLEGKSCYCIKGDHLDTARPVADSSCNRSCDLRMLDNCGGQDRRVAVYKLVQTHEMATSGTPESRQCVFMKRKAGGDEWNTASCVTLSGFTINGYICVDGASSAVQRSSSDSSNVCEKVKGSQMCYKTTIGTWSEAMLECQLRGGRLAGPIGRNDLTVLPSGLKYWTGIFRAFKPVSTASTKDSACLAVTRVLSRLVLEPDKCSAAKWYFCKQSLPENNDSYTVANTDREGKDGEPEETTSPQSAESKSSSKAKSKSNQIVTAIVVVLAVAIVTAAVAVVACLCIKRKRRRWRFKSETSDQENLYEEPDQLESAVLEFKDLTPPIDNLTVTNEPPQFIPKKSPSKPIRRTLRRQTQKTAYENVKIKHPVPQSETAPGTRKRDAKENDYDKVTLKCTPKFTPLDADGIGAHVYDHTIISADNGNYDTMRSVKSNHSLGRLDDSYNRVVLLTGCSFEGDQPSEIREENHVENSNHTDLLDERDQRVNDKGDNSDIVLVEVTHGESQDRNSESDGENSAQGTHTLGSSNQVSVAQIDNTDACSEGEIELTTNGDNPDESVGTSEINRDNSDSNAQLAEANASGSEYINLDSCPPNSNGNADRKRTEADTMTSDKPETSATPLDVHQEEIASSRSLVKHKDEDVSAVSMSSSDTGNNKAELETDRRLPESGDACVSEQSDGACYTDMRVQEVALDSNCPDLGDTKT